MKGISNIEPIDPPAVTMPIAVPRRFKNHFATNTAAGVNIIPLTTDEIMIEWKNANAHMLDTITSNTLARPSTSIEMPMTCLPP